MVKLMGCQVKVNTQLNQNMNNFYVYGHYKPDSDIPFYIGKGYGKRSRHKIGRNKHWHNIVNKYSYRVEIMYNNLTEAQAFDLEKEFIKRFGRADLGCGPLVNMTDGGEGMGGEKNPFYGKKHSLETKRKLSIIAKQRKGRKHSKETKQKMSISAKGKNTWTKGKTLSEEHKIKIGKSKVGKKRPEFNQQWIDNMKEAAKNRKYT